MSLLAVCLSVAVVVVISSAPALAQNNNDWTKMSEPRQEKPKHKEKIDFTYDKFQDFTSLRLAYMNVGDGVHLAAVASAKGRVAPSIGSAILMAFSLQNERWRCLDGCSVIFIIDGERLHLGQADHLDRKIGGPYGVTERIGVYINHETLKRVAYARNVEFQAGTDEAVLKATHLAALRDFAEHFFGARPVDN